MCGIFCALTHRPLWPPPALQKLLQQRGPDAASKTVIHLEEKPSLGTSTQLSFYSTVLSLRGDTTVCQPYQRQPSASTLCWNGEAWEVRGEKPAGNDTALVFDALEHAVASGLHEFKTRAEEVSLLTSHVAKELSTIAGPYAFIFHDAQHRVLFFGRDFLGRRSLLRKVTDEGGLLLSSVSDSPASSGWLEVEADGLYSIDLLQQSDIASHVDDCMRWGRHLVTKAPYNFADWSQVKHSSVRSSS